MRVLSSTVSALPNRLLATLSQADWDVLRCDLRRTHMARGQVLLPQDGPPSHAHFVEEGLVAVLAGTGDAPHQGRQSVQVAMVGNEGLVGGLPLLDGASPPLEATVQFSGSILSIPLATLAARMEEVPGLRHACLAYLHAFVAQVMQTAVSNAQDSVLRRCVRWLLMADERTGGGDLPVTHEALAGLLGVRRPGVTLAMAVLHREGLIQTRRGNVRLLDRLGLQGFAVQPAMAASRAG